MLRLLQNPLLVSIDHERLVLTQQHGGYSRFCEPLVDLVHPCCKIVQITMWNDDTVDQPETIPDNLRRLVGVVEQLEVP